MSIMEYEKYKREERKRLKEYFNDSGIKQNFLIEILCIIEKEYDHQIFSWFDYPFTKEKMITMDYENPEYIICKHIVGTYKSYTLFKSIDERKELEKSQMFKKRIMDEVVCRLNLNKYFKDAFRKKQLFCGDRFIYFSVPYYLFTICIYLLRILDEKSVYSSLRVSILKSAFAILDLLENNIIDEAYPIGRGIIENYIKLLCLIGNLDALKMREFLALEEISYNVCKNDFSKEFETLYSARKGKTNNKLYFLHYGFVDKIVDYYSTIGDDKDYYSITAMFRYLKSKKTWNQMGDLENLEQYYYMCHTYVHGNCSNAYPLNGYIELSEILYLIIVDIFKSVCNELKIDNTINGMNIMKYLEQAYGQLEEQKRIRNTELFEEYYKKF